MKPKLLSTSVICVEVLGFRDHGCDFFRAHIAKKFQSGYCPFGIRDGWSNDYLKATPIKTIRKQTLNSSPCNDCTMYNDIL